MLRLFRVQMPDGSSNCIAKVAVAFARPFAGIFLSGTGWIVPRAYPT